MNFFIEGSNLENHGSWPNGWRDHVGLAQTKLQELMDLKNVSWIGFRPLGQIYHVSLKGFWKRVSSRHKKRIVTQIDKSSSPMDLQHQNIARGPPPTLVGDSEVMPCHDFIN